MARKKKHLGVGAKCTVGLRYLHPKDKISQVIPNQTSSQKLTGLLVVGKELKPIRREPNECIVFRHEDFHNQPLWCVRNYVSINEEGPGQSFFEGEDERGAATAAAAQANGRAGNNNNDDENLEGAGDGGDVAANQAAEEEPLPDTIQELVGNIHLDGDDIEQAMRDAPMVDDDNMPAPENVPVAGNAGDIMIGWEHNGICNRKANVPTNPSPILHFVQPGALLETTNLQLFEGLFFKSYIEEVIIPATNNEMRSKSSLTYGEFLRWMGLWLLMSTMLGPQRHEFWSVSPIDAFDGATLRLGIWMSRNRFDEILAALQFTDRAPPTFRDKFWEVRQMLEAWQENMNKMFYPGYVNCLDESMSVWTNKFTCPGFMFVPRKPWPFGNEYHTVCCCTSGIMWGIELVEGRDRPRNLGAQEYDDLGSTVGLLLRMLTPIFYKGLLVILDSGFCVLKGIIELRKKGVFASALIKKRRYWPKYIRGEEIRAHFDGKDVGATDSWRGELDNTPFHIYAMKEPEYVMSLMSTYGTNARTGTKDAQRE
ncbi:hypothetical protein ACA910_016040 [Epithemia clementina (nom. ined.)]